MTVQTSWPTTCSLLSPVARRNAGLTVVNQKRPSGVTSTRKTGSRTLWTISW